MAKKNALSNKEVELPEINGLHENGEDVEGVTVSKRKLDDEGSPVKKKKKRKNKLSDVPVNGTGEAELESQVLDLLKDEKPIENGEVHESVGDDSESPNKMKDKQKKLKKKRKEQNAKPEEPQETEMENGSHHSSGDSDQEIDLMKKAFSDRLAEKTKEIGKEAEKQVSISVSLVSPY